jgi:hypothetical protein
MGLESVLPGNIHEVGRIDGAGEHAHQYLAAARFRRGHIVLDLEDLAGWAESLEDHALHGSTPEKAAGDWGAGRDVMVR